MILTIDIGNTNIVFGGMEQSRVCFSARLTTDTGRTAESYAAALSALLEQQKQDCPWEGAVLSSVVPQMEPLIKEAVRCCTGMEALVIAPGVKSNLQIRIDKPSQLGNDLLAGAVAVVAQYPLPAIIWDVGTATTVSVVDGCRCFRGGAIMPGPLTSLRALSHAAFLLPQADLLTPSHLIGTNTRDCMCSGAVCGSACLLDEYSRRVQAELGEKATVVLTGGLSAQLLPYCTTNPIYNPTLLLEGLYWLYTMNCPGNDGVCADRD